jgi:hypothetical protein
VKRRTSVAAFSVMSLMAAGLSVAVGAGSAQAADGDVSSQKAYIIPATGTNDSTAKIQLPITACPEDAAFFGASMFGPGIDDPDGQLIKGSGGLSEISDGAGLYQLQYSFVDAALDAGTPLIAGGAYRVNTYCQGAFGNKVGDTYDALFTVNSAGGSGTYQADVPAVANVNTTTTVTVPSTPSTAGSSVALSAAVSGSPSVGTVQFKDNGTDVGSPANVSAGAASASVVLPTAGSRSITAVYSGGTGFNGSTSPAVTYVVNAPAPDAVTTTTALAVVGTAGATTATPLSLTATVSPAAALGNVVFSYNGAAFGSPVPVTAGSATTTFTVPTAGPASIVATFVPTVPADFTGSASSPVAFLVTAPPVVVQPGDDPQTIVVPVAAGQLVIDTPYTSTSPLTLDPLVLNATATQLTGSKAFENILITDTRPGNNPWTASANAADLSSGSALINGQNVGLTGLVGSYVAGNALQAGGVTLTDRPAAAAVAPGDTGSLGLKGAKVIATAPVGRGTVTINGLLTVNAPTSTPTGSYTGIVTFTIG